MTTTTPPSPVSITILPTVSRPPPPRPLTKEEEIKRQKRARLFLLRHASKCRSKPGECERTTHCDEAKALWEHLPNCKDKKCKYPHCFSSKYVLTHYHRCANRDCDVCRPVRDARKRDLRRVEKTRIKVEKKE